MQSYSAIIFGLWMITLVYWATTAVFRKKYAGQPRQYLKAGISVASLLALVFLLVQLSSVQGFIKELSPVPVGPGAGVTSVILVAAGIGLATWARVHLGRNWGIPMTVAQEPELVTSGPYKFVRHPIYTGFILAMIGSALVSGGLGLFLAPLMCAYFVFSAFVEEKILTRHFPRQYPEYKKHSKMLVPFIF